MGLEGVCASSSSLGEKEHSKQHTASSALHGFLMLPPFVCRFSDRARVAWLHMKSAYYARLASIPNTELLATAGRTELSESREMLCNRGLSEKRKKIVCIAFWVAEKEGWGSSESRPSWIL